MWIPSAIVTWLQTSKEEVTILKEEAAVLRTERDAANIKAATAQANFDWLRVRVNQLEAERAQLIEKVYGIRPPIPEVIRKPNGIDSIISAFSSGDLFDDMGDSKAKEQGLPVYGD